MLWHKTDTLPVKPLSITDAGLRVPVRVLKQMGTFQMMPRGPLPAIRIRSSETSGRHWLLASLSPALKSRTRGIGRVELRCTEDPTLCLYPRDVLRWHAQCRPGDTQGDMRGYAADSDRAKRQTGAGTMRRGQSVMRMMHSIRVPLMLRAGETEGRGPELRRA